MSSDNEVRYSAEVKVEKVTTTPNPANRNQPARQVETFRVNVRSGDLDKLKAKIAGHMDLIEDEDIVETGR